MGFSSKNLTSLVSVALDNNASDIHIRENESPCLRIHGELVPVQTKQFSRDDIKDICEIMFENKNIISNIQNTKESDGGFEIPNVCRIRYNFFQFNSKFGLILRLVKNNIPSIESLGLPSVITKIAGQKRGLILVTGATGSGKSTTLASMINHINENKHSHILTIEDPIEYLHTQKKSRISQREIGKDTDSFTNGLRSSLRQDPDIILIGEMRDPETISTALKAAETGHLVLSTVHTTNALATIGRILGMFSPTEQEDVRKRLSENLFATIGQRMLKSSRGKGIVISMEVMITTPGVKEIILGKESLSRLTKIISEGRGKGGNGSQSFDQHTFELYKKGLISKETALSASESQSDFLQKLIVD